MIRKMRMAGVALLVAAISLDASAQEIVQPLPPPGAQKLADALDRLARNSQDVAALLDAGDAALMVGDIDAAIGFFGRANQLSPGNSRVKLGLARAYVRSRRPIEALRLFAEAERAGVSNARMAEDRGLAFDLVGDSASAQQLYRTAIAQGAGDEIVRRLALSHAIAGEREAFEATLLPLLERNDISAFRVRAFGLAILGDTEAAFEIADTMLNPQMARQMRSYLEYMPQLTPAQQAAAANLGVFPRAANIGTDNPRIAGYEAVGQSMAQRPDIRLEPSGPPLGSQSSPARQPEQSAQPPSDRSALEAAIAQSAATLPPAAGSQVPAEPVVISRESESVIEAARPAIQLPEPEPAQPEPASVVDAFEDFTLAAAPARANSANGAVDITTIDIPRERAEPKPPPPPAHPARHWVQVATGKDRSALAFDWRRIARRAEGKLDGKGPFVTPWGQANRLLAGPYESSAKAREIVNELRGLNVDSFPFSSAEGEEIDALQ